MATIEHYQRKAIELEVEIKFLKEQLDQASRSTSYLIGCFAQQQGHQLQHASTNRERELEAENVRLRHELRSALSRRDGAGLLQLPHLHGLEHGPRLDVKASLLESTNGVADVADDLLSFDVPDLSPASDSLISTELATGSSFASALSPDTPLTPPLPAHSDDDVFRPAQTKSAMGLGMLNIVAKDQIGAKAWQDFSTHATARVGHPSFAHRDTDMIDPHRFTEYNQDTGPAENDGWQAMRPPPPRQREIVFQNRFAHFEHARLSGLACWLEDKTSEEQEQDFQRLAEKDGRHSAGEWRKYYEEVVRLEYLAKTEKRGVALVTATPEKVESSASPLESDVVETKSDDDGQSAVTNTTGMPAAKCATVNAPADGEEAQSQVGRPGQQAAPLDQRPSEHPYKHTIAPITINGSQQQQDDSRSPGADGQDFYSESTVVQNAHVGIERSILPAPVMPIQTPVFVHESLPSMPDLSTSSFRTSKQSHPTDNDRPPQGPALAAARPTHRFSSYNSRIHRRDGVEGPKSEHDLLFQYGWPSSGCLLTVLISNIPITVTLTEVLDKVRGGKVIRATYLTTAGMKTVPPMSTNMVSVQFQDMRKANAFANFCQLNPMQFTEAGALQPTVASVELMHTPTRPLHHRLVTDLLRGNLTRIFFIVDPELRLTPTEALNAILERGWTHHIKYPLAHGRKEDSILFFEFAEIMDAAEVWNIVHQASAVFGGLSKGFLPDPCDRPLVARRAVAEGVSDGHKTVQTVAVDKAEMLDNGSASLC